ncbi:MAG TPA: molybdopterin-guanine dinucleotide biosynthesis protein A [Firmicutes bacterium]|nr:molybdopterin-guanine dinucleotide biosynthesis protein A [Bacillota bacterium]
MVDLMAEGVIIAAGYSSRAEGWKPGFRLGGKTLIDHCIEGMYPFCSRIVVVGGYRFTALARIVEKYERVELCYNRHFEAGMFSSVVAGFQQMRKPGFFYLPGDVPLVSQGVYAKLLQAKGEIVIPAVRGMTGHPVLFRQTDVKKTLRAFSYQSLREYINSQPHTIVDVHDPGILSDLDTPEDYRQMLKRFESR